jgi:ribosomal protein S18 acetylase RimI-like enzyme
MLIRKGNEEEMLKLWGYRDRDSASPTARFFYDDLSSGNAVFWTIERENDLIGELYVFLDLQDKDFANGRDRAYLCAFRVKRSYRGNGFGSQLMQTALQDLRERGFLFATIGVDPLETQNLRLYRRFGFEKKVKDCFLDPCAFTEDGQSDYDEKGWWLLIKDLSL